MSIERDFIVLLIYIFISLISKSTLLAKLIKYTSITSIEDNRFIKSKLSLINEDIISYII